MKQRQLKSSGKGNLPNKKDPLSSDDIEELWRANQLGAATPDSILQTLWFYTTIHFGLRGCQEHRDMCWGDVTLKRDDGGCEYLEFSERQTKTRTRENPRDIRTAKPNLWANMNNPDRCPIKIYKKICGNKTYRFLGAKSSIPYSNHNCPPSVASRNMF